VNSNQLSVKKPPWVMTYDATQKGKGEREAFLTGTVNHK